MNGRRLLRALFAARLATTHTPCLEARQLARSLALTPGAVCEVCVHLP